MPTSAVSKAVASCAAADARPDDPAVVALVERVVASRDQAAFGELYDRFVDPIYRYVFYRTGSPADAEDLSEQVFLHAWSRIQRFRWQGKPFQAWLYTLAHNIVVDHYRRARPTAPLDTVRETADLASEPATRDLERWLNADLLGSAIGRLPSDQQQVIATRFLEARDTAEVARLMGKSEAAIRTLQYQALRALRTILERQGEEGEW